MKSTVNQSGYCFVLCRNSVLFLSCATLFLCVQFIHPAYGYVFLSDPPASGYAMNLDLSPATAPANIQYGTTWNAVAQKAMDSWNLAGVGPQQDHNFFSVKSPKSTGNACAQDGVNEVTFAVSLCGVGFGSALAVTREWSVNGKRVEEDMLFDSSRAWAVYSGALQSGKVDFYRVALHEFGHVVGLDHPDVWGQTRSSLMNSIISNIDSIQQDDIDGGHLVNWFWFNFPTQNGVAPNTLITSAPITVSGITTQTAISITGGQYSIDGGAYTSVAGTVTKGQTVTLQVFSSSAAKTATTATLSMGNASADFSVITIAGAGSIAVNTANYNPLVDGAFKTYSKNGVAGYTETVLSGTAIVNNIATKAIQSSDGSMTYVTNDANGIREHQGYDPNFYMPGAGIAPLTMTFSPPLLDAPANIINLQTYNSTGTLNYSIPLAGINSNLSYNFSSTPEAFETITVPAGTYNTIRIQSSLTMSGNVSGQSINQTVTGTSWIASGIGLVKDVSFAGDVNTRLLTTASNLALDPVPDAFSFTGQTNVPANGLAFSNPVTITGINTPSDISITGGQYNVNGGSYSQAAGKVNAGDVVTVLLITNNSYNTQFSATLTIGGVSGVFNVLTVLNDTVPDAFSFNAKTGVDFATLIVSNPITVSGINAVTPISITGGEYSINGGSYSKIAGAVNNADVVTVRVATYALYNTTSSATLTIGGISSIFSATTHNNPSGTVVRLQTSLGPIDVALFDTAAPLSVANFMSYVNSAAYTNSFIHRSVPGFIIQGGGYTWSGGNCCYSVVANAPVLNEYSATRSNLRGTLAMAKLGSSPDSATTQWFINLADNSANLDFQNGGFTVFGQVIGNGMQVADAIAALQWVNAGGGGVFANLPVVNYSGGSLQQANFVMVNSIAALPAPATINLNNSWNLLGNATDAPLDVASKLGDANSVTTVWKWVPASSTWAFYAPAMTTANLNSYAASKGYQVLNTVNSGEGFWVNAKAPVSLQMPAGNPVVTSDFQDQTDTTRNRLLKGWNLIATADNKTPGEFNLGLAAGIVPINLISLWAWDSSKMNWYFYAPDLDAKGNLSTYIQSKAYLDFTYAGKTLSQGVGFWLNKP
jgi:cyclophilin family peptidyl-prolyl cis-trans isomerase